MKSSRTKPREKPKAAKLQRSRWPYVVALFLTVYCAFQSYAPALSGPFLFDDAYLPFNLPDFPDHPLGSWIRGVRPLLMFSFWLNYRLSGLEPSSYHLFNICFHVVNTILLFYIVRKLLGFAGETGRRRDVFAAFAAALFLLHPVQTEAVAYVAGRSENLSVMFFFAAFAVFLYRRSDAISWPAVAGVLALFGAAAATKEHTVVLPALLLVTDYYWNPGFSFAGVRRNWRLYATLGAGAILAVAAVLKMLARATTAGFGVKDFTWYQYFFTQCRAFFVYLRLFLLPFGQTIDYDFAISRNLLDRGALFGLIGIVLLIAAAIYFRRRDRLASYGLLVFILLLAPTSSFIPIKDPLAERRLYLPMIGLLLMVVGLLRHVKLPLRTLAIALVAIALLAAIVTYNRNHVWTEAIALWEDTVRKSPGNSRAHFQLAHAYFREGRCEKALPEYERVAQIRPPTADLLVDWALAYDCLNNSEQALAKLRQAASLERTAHVYSQIGMLQAKQRRWAEALESLEVAEKLNPHFAMIYVYRGNIHASVGDFAAAAQDFRRALAVNPNNQLARDGLAMAERRLGSVR